MTLFPDKAGPNITDWLQAIGTIGAVIIALFFFFWERIHNWWIRPRLQISLQFKPPDCHRLSTTGKRDDGRDSTQEAFWFRLTVTNNGRTSAKDLEAIIADVEQKTGDSWKTYSPFLPTNLKWTHINAQYLPMLLPKTEKKLDLGHIMDPNFRQLFFMEKNPSLRDIPPNRVLFHFEVVAQPSNGYNNIPPGEYRFKVTVGAANCKPVSKTISLSFTGNWNLEENVMLGQEVNLVVM